MSKEALGQIRGLARAGRIKYSWHVRTLRMPDRNVSYEDVEHALANATSCSPGDGDDEKWVVIGPDMDGDNLKVVVVIEDGVFVITVYDV